MNAQVVRIEDLPYFYSPPMQWTFSQSATLTLGQYPFTGARAVVNGAKNITDNSLLYIKSASFSADISILDYEKAIQLPGGTVDVPRFSLFMDSEANAPLFRDPIQLLNYFNDQEYKLLAEPRTSSGEDTIVKNRLSGFFRGTLQQHANLAGISAITLNMVVYIQEIIDGNFINALKLKYPQIITNNR